MTAFEVGKKLVELCKQGQNDAAVETLYGPGVVSVEAGAPPGGGQRETRGLPAVIDKGKGWSEAHIIHSQEVEGPFPHDDRFIVRFKYDVTNKASGRRFTLDEAGLFTVADGKIVREEFFYPTGP